MPCNVCKHNQVKDIDRALLTGVSLTSLSKTYGFSTEALRLHHKHLDKKMALAQQRFHDGLHQGLLCKLSIVMELVLGVVRGARAGEDFKLFLQATREFTRIISLMVKMEARLEPEMIYCLMASPQWDLQEGTLLPNSTQALSATRQSLKVNLFAPCPEPEPVPTPEPAATQPSIVETCKLNFETLTAAASPGAVPKPVWPQASQPETGVHPQSGNQARNEREINAKLARKIPPTKHNNEIIHEVKVNEKNSPPKRENLFRRVFGRWEKSGKLPGNSTLADNF